MFSPLECKTCGFSPATTNQCNISNSGLNEPGFSSFPIGALAYDEASNGLTRKPFFPSRVPPLSPSEYISEQSLQKTLFRAGVDVLTSTNGAPSHQKKFLIFDQNGNETRLIDSTCLFPQNAPQRKDSPLSQFVIEDQPNKRKQVYDKKYDIIEESGDKETIDEDGEMHENTEEINALLYSDDDDFDVESEDDDDEMSTGNSPPVNQEHDFDEVGNFDRSTKRQKTLDGDHNKPPFLSTKENRYPSNKTIDGEELVSSSNEGSFSPNIANKRVRKDNIRDTLRVLESIVPGLKSKDPVIILDEAINYLKRLKSNTKTSSSTEDLDGSCCYGPSN